jgi:CheY-like chemotaxis protein
MSAAKILLVDDNDDVREITALFLRDCGHHVIEASSGSTALRLLEADAGVNLLITDFAMPEMSGTELLERVRAKYPKIRFMFITGYAGTQLGGQFTDEIVITKPFTTEQLASAVRQAMVRLEDLS